MRKRFLFHFDRLARPIVSIALYVCALVELFVLMLGTYMDDDSIKFVSAIMLLAIVSVLLFRNRNADYQDCNQLAERMETLYPRVRALSREYLPYDYNGYVGIDIERIHVILDRKRGNREVSVVFNTESQELYCLSYYSTVPLKYWHVVRDNLMLDIVEKMLG